jgi:transcriptional regulator with XRE-family HTH domain
MFGDILRNIRNRRGWTQKQLAEKAKVAKVNIEKYEEIARMPTYLFLEALVKNAGVDPKELFCLGEVVEPPIRKGGDRRSARFREARLKAQAKA